MKAEAPFRVLRRSCGLAFAIAGAVGLAVALPQSPNAQEEGGISIGPAAPADEAAPEVQLRVEEPKPAPGPSQEALQQMVETEGGAVYRGLDKITARVSTVYAPIDEVVSFGSLRFVTRQCNKRPPEETPEKTAFLEVKDVKPDQSEEDLFTGWMFASSPALNALEHPVYDIWLIDCIILEPEILDESDVNSAG